MTSRRAYHTAAINMVGTDVNEDDPREVYTVLDYFSARHTLMDTGLTGNDMQNQDFAVAKLDERYPEGRACIQEKLTFLGENDAVRGKLLFQSLGVDASDPNKPEYHNGGGLQVLGDT